MCGIVGVVSNKDANEKLFTGLSNLEYRGYDSVGMCFLHNNKFQIKKYMIYDKGLFRTAKK